VSVHLSASVSPGSLPGWLAVRHVVSRLQVDRAALLDDGNVLARSANTIRRVLVRGAELLGQERRTLFTGLVIGDDREQPVEITDDFLGAVFPTCWLCPGRTWRSWWRRRPRSWVDSGYAAG
jgi:hypothetical protein